MPEMNGLEVQERLNQMKLKLPVIVMTGQGDVQSAVRAMRSGATDFLEKPFSDDALICAIEAAPKVSAEPNRSAERAAALIDTLSPRERQVLEALVAGHPNKAIAFDLGISVRTVELHRARMMARLGVRQFAEAVRLAVLANLAGDR
jgi:two-component system response regulator FixJ